MKFKLTFLLLTFSLFLFSQNVKTYESYQECDSDFFDYEDYDENQKPIGSLEFLKGCNWYCGGTIKSITSSSELEENNGITYSPINAHDFDKDSSWVEGKPGYGIGEFIEYEFDFSEDIGYNGNLGINKLIIANGYKNNLETWKNNSRVKQLELFLNNESFCVINLIDSFEIQTVDIEIIKFPVNKPTKLKFVIIDVYCGDKYQDTAISLLMFDGVGVH